jgi:large subunit ribosomal protein L27
MAHKKAGGSTALGRDSVSKRLGVKLFGGQKVSTGNIIVRQHGSKFRAGKNVRMGGDGTLYSVANGTVQFSKKKIQRFNGSLAKTRIVNVVAGE